MTLRGIGPLEVKHPCADSVLGAGLLNQAER
jgi:hypothetical protein